MHVTTLIQGREHRVRAVKLFPSILQEDMPHHQSLCLYKRNNRQPRGGLICRLQNVVSTFLRLDMEDDQIEWLSSNKSEQSADLSVTTS